MFISKYFLMIFFLSSLFLAAQSGAQLTTLSMTAAGVGESATDFGTLEINKIGNPKTVVITNTGANPATGCSSGSLNDAAFKTSAATASPPMSVCSGTLGVSSSCYAVVVQAQPNIQGAITSSALSYTCSNASISEHFTVTGGPPVACTGDGEFKASDASCQCADGYDHIYFGSGLVCRPHMKSNHFFNDASSGYPVCGVNSPGGLPVGRIPVNANGAVLNLATSYLPNSSSTSIFGTKDLSTINTYNYAKPVFGAPAPAPPEYLYPPDARCACTARIFAPASPATYADGGTANQLTSTLKPMIPGETYSIISSQSTTNHVDYSPVAIAKDSTGSIDGRKGSIFQSGASQCACPNLNEKMVLVDPGNPNTPQGAYCQPALDDKVDGISRRVLVPFDPAVHDAPGKTQIIDRAHEPQVAGVITPKIALPITANGTSTMPYTRRIWACAYGMTVNVNANPPVCVFDETQHQCSGSSLSGAPASSVSDVVTGSTPDLKFANAVNKKQNCCSSVFTTGYNNVKFDCVENYYDIFPTFDDLWAGADYVTDGGQLYAVVLRDASGKPISGFYRLDGSRCNQYSEFGGILQPARVNPARSITGQIAKVSSTFENVGSPLKLPSNGTGAAAYTALQNQLPNMAVPYPNADKMLECPILVRSAITVECPPGPALPGVQPTYREADPGGPAVGRSSTKTRCTSAMNIHFHTQVRQITEIMGSPMLKTFDTISNPKAASSISVRKLIDSLNGGQCPDGAKRVGNGCIYQ